jgi:cytochrome b
VSFLFLLLAIQMVTGLVLAGTDLFWPPFGGLFAGWVAAPGVDASLVQPGLSELMNEEAYRAMREFRSPFILVHKLTFYVLAAMIVLHIVVVAAVERYEGGNIISAMFTGRKTLARKPPDE